MLMTERLQQGWTWEMDKFGIKQAVNVKAAEIQFKENQMWAKFYLNSFGSPWYRIKC